MGLEARVIDDAPDCILGEAPFWDWTTKRLLWVDIVGKRVHAYDPISTDQTSWETPDRSPPSYRRRAETWCSRCRTVFTVCLAKPMTCSSCAAPTPTQQTARTNAAAILKEGCGSAPCRTTSARMARRSP